MLTLTLTLTVALTLALTLTLTLTRCWAHIWRAVRTNRGKLKDSSSERVDMLYTDLCFLHEVPCEPLLAQLARPAGLNPTRP